MRLGKSAFAVLLATLIVLTGFGVGCGGGGNSGDAPRDEIQRNRQLWNSRAIPSYRYTLLINGFLPPEARGPVRVEVRNGKMVSIEPVDPAQTIYPATFSRYDNLDKLFDLLQSARSQNPILQRQTFDATNGYPDSAFIDFSQQIADEELGFEVTNFAPVTTP